MLDPEAMKDNLEGQLLSIVMRRQEAEQDEEACRRMIEYFSSSRAVSGNGKKTSPGLNDAIYSHLKEMRQPVHRKQLYAQVIDSGLEVAGRDPVANMTAHMSNDARFESTKGDGMWGLTEWSKGKTPNSWVNRLNEQLVEPPEALTEIRLGTRSPHREPGASVSIRGAE